MNVLKKPWIIIGYELFAKEGPTGLKIETIAKKVNKSKSSFYHHFANREIFIDYLLTYHLKRTKIIAEKESLCKNVVPELCQVIVEFKQDLLFNRQLRIHRNNPQFRECFEKGAKEVSGAILGIWATALGLDGNAHLAQLVLNLSMENFYLQITEESLTYDWLVSYFNELKTMVNTFKRTNPIGR